MENILSKHWKNFDIANGPFIHPADKSSFAERNIKLTEHFDGFQEYVEHTSFGRRDGSFHGSLLPVPYGGNLARADIFILLLNPGFDPSDYYSEMVATGYRDRLAGNLQQNFDGIDYPFPWLDPKFCWTGGFRWWESKLRGVAEIVAADEQFKGVYREALKHLANRIAAIELCPYHSASFENSGLLRFLPSTKIAMDYVANELLPRCANGDVTVIVTRKTRMWGVERSTGDLIVYQGGHTRGASLGPQTEGGRAILKRVHASGSK